MPSVVSSLLLALGQLADPRVLRILAKSVAVTVVLVVAIAWGGWLALDWGLDRAGLDEGLFEGAGWLRQAAALALTLVGLWLVWRIVAMAVIGFFADPKTPWAHLDMASMAWADADAPTVPKGAVGWGVQLLDELARTFDARAAAS